MSARQTLPNRRPCETVEFEHDGIRYIASIGRFPSSDAVSEVFMHGGKTGSAAEIAAHDGAITLSLALQFGTPLSAIRHALIKLRDGSAAGPIGKLLDLIDAEQHAR
jgi:hypothetical protein